MPRAPQPCKCGAPSTTGRCPGCTTQARKRAERRRPSAKQRGYTGTHHTFRRLVLHRDPWCVCPGCPSCSLPTRCARDSTDADHHPKARSELVASGMNPNDPKYGRGLCGRCHWQATIHDHIN